MAKAKTKPVEIFVVVDRSGSMDSIRDEAIGGFNTFLEAQKKEKGAANLTLAIFDGEYDIVYDSVKLKEVMPMTRETLVPRGLTALNDAIGKSLLMLEGKKPDKAILCILTDGQENASREFNGVQVKAKVEAAEARGWQVVFLAANIDVAATAKAYGMNPLRSMSFMATGAGTTQAYSNISASVTSYRGDSNAS